jgi:LAO/AO transport system kinase
MPPELAERLLARERSAVSPALNLVDDTRDAQRAQARELLDHLEAEGAGCPALRVGITGAPGAGKSTLLDALVRALRADANTVGIIAVDPSSQRSGGALLGDRVRMRSGAADDGVFLRSMAARDRLGGLADATHASVSILSAVFDFVFVETVGVGQSESEVAQLVDTLVFVAQPGAGDTLQFMKAGLLELPDVFLVNKADQDLAMAERTASELAAGLGLGEARSGGWKPPVIVGSAREGGGVDALVDAIRQHRAHLEASDQLEKARLSSRVAFVSAALARRYGSYGVDVIGGLEALEARVRDDTSTSATGLTQRLGETIEAALRRAKP